MQQIIFDKPYVPVPPYHGRIWPTVLTRIVRPILRRSYGIEQIEVIHSNRLSESIRAGHGIILAPNHCRDEDPLVLGALSEKVKRPFFLVASWHVFMQGRLRAFLLRRAGGFSIYREGVDRGAVNTSIDILEKAERPLVIFPEGLVSRTNDRINSLMEGVSLIARTAAKKRAKLDPPGKLVVHPIALRYKFHGQIDRVVSEVLDQIEARLTWQPSRQLPQMERIYRVGGALLTLKELEYLGQPRSGELNERLTNLVNAILNPLEEKYLPEPSDPDESVPERVKRLRTAILPDMVKGTIDEPERQRRWKQLADLYLAQQLHHYPANYARSNPTPERLLETIERFEEDLTDVIRVHGPISATVTVGEAIEVNPAREGRGSADPLLQQIEAQLRAMLEIPPPSSTEDPT